MNPASMNAAARRTGLTAWAFALVLGCNGAPPIDTDAGCGEPGVPADQPSLGCPAEVDLGCVGPSGAALAYTVSAASCDGSEVSIVCDPASGTTLMPGGAGLATCTATAPSGASASCSFPIRMQVQGPPQLSCASDVSRACTAQLTPVSLPAAVAMESCDGTGMLSTPVGDAPAAGFPVGSTAVTYTANTTAGETVTCSTQVVITDTEAPSITCPAGPQTLIRTAPSALILNFSPPAVDTCDDRVSVTVTPSPTGRGDTAVVATATDDAGNTASCDAVIRVLDVFAVENLRVISATMTPTGTDVTLAWEPSLGLDVVELAIERADAMAGPFTELMRVPPGTTTFTDADLAGAQAFYRVVSLGPSTTRGGITDTVRAFDVAAAAYQIDGVTVPGVPFNTSLRGLIRHPVDLSGGPYPLVVLLHGNHGNCRPTTGDDRCEERTTEECTDPRFATTPNADGYAYLMETLAAQGHIAVSLSANALNCRDDFIGERTALIMEHLRRWAARTLPIDSAVMSAADLGRTALVGHSRGGEAVSQVPSALRATPITGVTLASVFAVGPTDYHDNTPSGVPYLALLPSCDADVRDLAGARMVDRGANTLDGQVHGHLLFVGANHNFFNTEWRFDDNAGGAAVCSAGNRLNGSAMRAGLEDVLSTWVRSHESAAALPDYLRAGARSPVSLDTWADRGLDLRVAYFARSRVVIDDFSATPLGPVAFSGFTAAVDCTGTCARNFPHVTSAARLAWDTASATASFGASGLDASAFEALSMRFASRSATVNNGIEEHDFTVRLVDASGTTAEVLASDVGRVPTVYGAFQPLEVLGTLRVPFDRVRAVAPTFDFAHVARVELSMPVAGSERGSLWISDLEMAGG